MNKPEILLVDLDGTVANCEHRKKYIDDVIRVGDTVYIRGIHDSASHPFNVTDENDTGYVWTDPKLGNNWIGTWVPKISLRKKRDYKRFFESCKDDSPIQTTIDIVSYLRARYPVMFCSGRPEEYKGLTMNWLAAHGIGLGGGDTALIMRPTGDMRQDYIVKKELYLTHIEPFYTVKCVFDDRQQVVDMWRSLGLICYQVAKGDF